MTTTIPEISIIIPAFNEGLRLGLSQQAVIAYFEANALCYEVIVVDDGSSDDTAAVVERLGQKTGNVRLITSPVNRGKGYAVRIGILSARYDLILTTDADLSTPIEEVEKLLACLAGADIAIGSRACQGAELRRPQSLLRRSLGMSFNRLLRFLRLTQFNDTQCGFKLWKAQAAREVFARSRINGFAYDVEALVLAKLLGYRVVEVGVIWTNSPDSKVNIFYDSLRMLLDAVAIFIKTKCLRRIGDQGRDPG